MSENRKILVVEDDTFLRELYHEMLTDAGYDTDIALDGEEAVLKINANQYGLILLDIMMPKKDGLQVLKEINDVNRKKVIMLTNLGQDQVIKNALAAGASGYLIKSEFSPDELESKVSELMGLGETTDNTK